MNASELLNMLLSAGQSMAEKGKTVAEEKLDIPEEGGERSAMLNGMGKGALAAGALALLLGTKTGRSVGGGALKLGSLAALGGLAYKAYQNWQSDSSNEVAEQTTSQPVAIPSTSEPAVEASDKRSQKLLQAIIAAAKADGYINADERGVINEFIQQLGESSELTQFVKDELAKPLDPAEIAANTDVPGLAAEVYLMSKVIINDANFMEKAYLTELSQSLNLPSALVTELDKQAEQTVA